MYEVAQVTRFGKKFLQCLLVHLAAQDFDGDLGIKIEVSAQVDISEGACAKQTV
jgi:hypothetical protein